MTTQHLHQCPRRSDERSLNLSFAGGSANTTELASGPNWIKEHDERFPGPDQWQHVVTHPTVIEAVARWVAERLQGRGSIIICAAPQTDSSFATLRKYCGLDTLLERCRAGEFCLELEAVIPGIRQRYLGCGVLRTPVAHPVFLREYQAERLMLEAGLPVSGLHSIGRNGEFAHILMEDVYWRILRKVHQLAAAL